ncbi:MAG: Porphobilinogen deaminase [Verrucomicrobiales bacterium]|nr:Porphobilinogen deaminase [Verrucomicrobiales bacterium]
MQKPIVIVTRGSALALVQAHMVQAQCRAAFPESAIEIKILKTTGDKLQTAALASANLPKGLFTKELETALLNGEGDLAVHSLKDLPTELPPGLKLGAVSKRADVRDVMIYRDPAWLAAQGLTDRRGLSPHTKAAELPPGATVATSSTRRSAQLLEKRPDLKIVPIRGNVGTRLKKLADQPELDAIVLAAAGLERLGFQFQADGKLTSPGMGEDAQTSVPPGLLATRLDPAEMLPCVGQAALGLEIREHDPRMEAVCAKLNDPETQACVLAERAFLRAMGGGCQVPVGALAELRDGNLWMRAVSFLGPQVCRAQAGRPLGEAEELGQELGQKLSAR